VTRILRDVNLAEFYSGYKFKIFSKITISVDILVLSFSLQINDVFVTIKKD